MTPKIYSSPYPGLDYPNTDVFNLVFGNLSEAEAELPAITELSTGSTVTFSQLKEFAETIAAALHARGIGEGDVVTLQVPNSINFVASFLGILKLGAIVNPVGTLMNQADVEHIITASGAKLFIGPTNMEQLPQIFSMELGALQANPQSPPEVTVDPDAVATIPFSSGTTGMPKGVQLTHRNLVSNICQVQSMLQRSGIERQTHTLSVLPFSHIYGLTVLLLTPLLERHHVFTMPKFDLKLFLGAHAKHEIALTFIAPPMAIAMANAPEIDPAWFSASRLMVSSAAPLDASMMRAVEERLGTTMVQGWGMTETSPLVTFCVPGATALGTVGRPAPDSAIRVVDMDTLEDVPEGETGEVLVRGPQVMKGYLNNEEANAATLLEGGWLRTGDVARIEEDGGLRIVDRAKEVIKYKGYQVAPAELEALLLEHPSVADVGVVGVQSNGLEIPRAFVVKKEGATLGAQELMGWVADRVTPYKKVRAVDFIDQIPKNATGKILRRELADIPFPAN